MTEIAEVKTIGDVERIVHGSGMWDGTEPVEFSDDGDAWVEAWAPTKAHTVQPAFPFPPARGARDHPEYARVTVYRKDVRIGTRVTIRWDEQRPRENEEWAAKWDAAPTRHFGRTARMVAFRQTFRDILGDVSIEDEERTTGPAPETEAPVEDWAALIEAAEDLENLDAVDKAARAVKAFTPDAQGTALHRQLRAKRIALAKSAEANAAAWEPAPGPSENAQGPATPERLAELNEMVTRPRPQDHLPGNRASRRAKKKRGGRR